MFPSTMSDVPLNVPLLLRHGRDVHGGSSVVTPRGSSLERHSFQSVAQNAAFLAQGLWELGVAEGDRVASLCWNHREHLEAYLAVPSMGSVLHTVNPRLPEEHLRYVLEEGGAEVLLVDADLLEQLAPILQAIETIKHLIVVGESEHGAAIPYGELLDGRVDKHDWVEVDEKAAAGLCFTSGTTGRPKGVAYSHRSVFVHSMALCAGNAYRFSDHDRILVVVPMFHAHAWGLPYSGWLSGADLILPGRDLSPAALSALIEESRPTVSSGVPTIWNDLLEYSRTHNVDMSSFRMVVGGGSAVSRSLIEDYQDELGVRLYQGWGLTETSPLAALAVPPKGAIPGDDLEWRAKTGRLIGGVELRLVGEDGEVVPWNDEDVGEIELRGPWVTERYLDGDDPTKFRDGWLRTGDIGRVHPSGFVTITDRAKDLIKSGGEWISSIELEQHLVELDDVVEAAVVSVPDERWQERPLACVVLREKADASVESLREHLLDRFPRWWVPDRWMFLDAIPRTTVGKYDKRALQRMARERDPSPAETRQGSDR